MGGRNADARKLLLNFALQQLKMTEQELLTTQAQLRRARIDLEVLKQREQTGQGVKVSDHAVAEALSKMPAIQEARAEILRLEGQVKQVVERSSEGEADPAVLRAKKEIAQLKQKVEETSARVRPEIVKQLSEQVAAEVKAAIAAKKERIAVLEMMEKALEPEAAGLRQRVVDLGRQGPKLKAFQENLAHIEELCKRLKAEHEVLRIELDAPQQTVAEETVVARVVPEPTEWMPAGGAAFAAVCFAFVGIAGSRWRREPAAVQARQPNEGAQGEPA